jgi:hypothetical protein
MEYDNEDGSTDVEFCPEFSPYDIFNWLQTELKNMGVI